MIFDLKSVLTDFVYKLCFLIVVMFKNILSEYILFNIKFLLLGLVAKSKLMIMLSIRECLFGKIFFFIDAIKEIMLLIKYLIDMI